MRIFHLLKVVLFVLLFSLLGCKQKVTYLYLLQHPNEIESRISTCQLSDSDECKLVKQASEDFLTLNNQRIQDPELFGRTILLEQEKLLKTKEELQALQNEMKSKNDAAMQKKLTALNEVYQEQSKKVATLLAIVASTSPE